MVCVHLSRLGLLGRVRFGQVGRGRVGLWWSVCVCAREVGSGSGLGHCVREFVYVSFCGSEDSE